jgi:predicted DNA-binding ribbon-helix-helix protein
MPQSAIVKRSIVARVEGDENPKKTKKTSVSMEDEFWNGFKEIASERGMMQADLTLEIKKLHRHDNSNLSSAIRLFVHNHTRAKLAAAEEKLRSAAARARSAEEDAETRV